MPDTERHKMPAAGIRAHNKAVEKIAL